MRSIGGLILKVERSGFRSLTMDEMERLYRHMDASLADMSQDMADYQDEMADMQLAIDSANRPSMKVPAPERSPMHPIAADGFQLTLELLHKDGKLDDMFRSLPSDVQMRLAGCAYNQHGETWAGCTSQQQLKTMIKYFISR